MGLSLDSLQRGHVFPAVSFDLSEEWVRDYVVAVEDDAIHSLGRNLVPPMAVAALAVRAVLQSLRLPSGAIHLGQEMSFQRPARIGDRLAVSARIASRGDRQGWTIMSVDLAVTCNGNLQVMEGRATVTMPASAEAGADGG